MTPDGMVKALVGGVDYQRSQYNRAVTAFAAMQIAIVAAKKP